MLTTLFLFIVLKTIFLFLNRKYAYEIQIRFHHKTVNLKFNMHRPRNKLFLTNSHLILYDTHSLHCKIRLGDWLLTRILRPRRWTVFRARPWALHPTQPSRGSRHRRTRCPRRSGCVAAPAGHFLHWTSPPGTGSGAITNWSWPVRV